MRDCVDTPSPAALSLSGGVDSSCLALAARDAGADLPCYQFRADGRDRRERDAARAVADRAGLVVGARGERVVDPVADRRQRIGLPAPGDEEHDHVGEREEGEGRGAAVLALPGHAGLVGDVGLGEAHAVAELLGDVFGGADRELLVELQAIEIALGRNGSTQSRINAATRAIEIADARGHGHAPHPGGGVQMHLARVGHVHGARVRAGPAGDHG